MKKFIRTLHHLLRLSIMLGIAILPLSAMEKGEKQKKLPPPLPISQKSEEVKHGEKKSPRKTPPPLPVTTGKKTPPPLPTSPKPEEGKEEAKHEKKSPRKTPPALPEEIVKASTAHAQAKKRLEDAKAEIKKASEDESFVRMQRAMANERTAQQEVDKTKQQLKDAMRKAGTKSTSKPKTIKPAGESSKLVKLREQLKAGKLTQEQFDAEKVNIDLDTDLAALKKQKMSEEKYLSEQAKLRSKAEYDRAAIATRNLSIQKENLATARTQLDEAKTPADIEAAFAAITTAQRSVENATNAIEGANMNARRFKIMQDTSQAKAEGKLAQETIQKNQDAALEDDVKVQSTIRITRLESEIQSLTDDIANLKQQKAKKVQSASQENKKKIGEIFDENIKLQELNLDSKQQALGQHVKAKGGSSIWQKLFGSKKVPGTK